MKRILGIGMNYRKRRGAFDECDFLMLRYLPFACEVIVPKGEINCVTARCSKLMHSYVLEMFVGRRLSSPHQADKPVHVVLFCSVLFYQFRFTELLY